MSPVRDVPTAKNRTTGEVTQTKPEYDCDECGARNVPMIYSLPGQPIRCFCAEHDPQHTLRQQRGAA